MCAANDEIDAQSPGLHISTFIRQTAFDILYLTEFIILLGFGFSAQIVRGEVQSCPAPLTFCIDGYLNHYTHNFIWIVVSFTVLALSLKGQFHRQLLSNFVY